MKKLISIFIIIFSISICAAASGDSEAKLLAFLDIVNLENCDMDAPCSIDSINQMISNLTGKSSEAASNERNEVIRTLLNALDYDYTMSEKTDKAYFELAEKIGLLKNLSLPAAGSLTNGEAVMLATNCLSVNVVQKIGYIDDPQIEVQEKQTILTENFGAKYASGIVSGFYGDGITRVDPLWKNQVEIENVIYIYDDIDAIKNCKIYFTYVERNNKKYIITIQDTPDIIVTERTGVSGRQFFRRGIPFADGELQNPTGIYLKRSDGFEPPVQNQVLERYPSGCIKFLSMAFMLDVEAYESYEFKLIFENKTYPRTVTAQTINGSTVIQNETLQVVTSTNGISDIKLKGSSIVKANGCRLYVKNNIKSEYFTVKSVKVVATGSVYAQVVLDGTFSGLGVDAKWILYLYQGDSKLYHEVKFNVKGENTLYTEGIELNLLDSFQSRSYQDNAQIAGDLISSTWLNMQSSDNKSVVLSSKDVVRFEKATAPTGVWNGYANANGSSTVLFAPIQYNSPFIWPDGVTRTIHLTMSFSDTLVTEAQIERDAKWAFTPPSLTVASDRFVKTGWIADNSLSEALLRTDRLVSNLYSKSWKWFEAGKLPNNINIDYDTYDISYSEMHRSAGETEYNLWTSYMASGNPKLYDMLLESAEHWTDIMMYRGQHTQLVGSNRYKSGNFFNDNREFCMSMPFYGDMSGIFLTYLMTGDPYYEESFKLGIDFWNTSVEINGVPILSHWWSYYFTVHSSPEFQTRFMMQVRGLYYAYEFYNDEKYLNSAKSIARWVAASQNADGSLYDEYDAKTKAPRYTTINGKSTLLEQFYIMLFGARGMIDFYNKTGYEPALTISTRLADFLMTQMEEDGWQWSPNKDNDIYDVGNAHGCDGSTNACSIYFYAEVYKATGEEKYFNTMAKFLRFYLSSWGGGNTDRVLATGKATFLKSSQTVSRLLKDNADLAMRLGYADLLALIDDNTTVRTDLYPNFNRRNYRFALNAFDTTRGRVVYLNNVELSHYPDYKAKIFDLDFLADSSNALWYGDINTLTGEGVRIKRPIEAVDLVYLMKTDLSVVMRNGDLTAQITEYTKDKIVVKLTGSGNTIFSLKNGFFAIDDTYRYKIKVNEEEKIAAPNNGELLLDASLTKDIETTIVISRIPVIVSCSNVVGR